MILPEDIELVNQVDDSTCVHAVLSMVTGRSIQDVIDMGDNEDGLSERGFVRFLMREMILPVPCHSFMDSPFRAYGVYRVCAPSLNKPGRLHAMMVTSTPKDGYTVFDPQNMRAGKLFYPFGAMKKGSTQRVSYVEVVRLEDMSL